MLLARRSAVRFCSQFSPRLAAAIHTTRVARTEEGHNSDSYAKDVDFTPPSDPKIYRIDPDAHSAQKPYEPPSSQWSEVGAKSALELGYNKTMMMSKEEEEEEESHKLPGAVPEVKEGEGFASAPGAEKKGKIA
ncbi:uncharacterized protein BT62DRAFT_792376 [Guyanagaster necrorhizus]|uniref:Uncharacterized protein n=1 Tax=Guyanagaster necrorhizus TaxID=856835 RepID=A0A9P8ATU6_9AGAR|nr:uncharacterized protein BT62DRAFT_792376 [Guyanagaster necrorhizus MCA 3950]KAG7447784.1 hypothetical protein BT62DRAFT_792376 [Guyanagaster necrorhizus MCA 3950]